MAAFHYRLQNVLNIKLQLENQEKINFGLANAALQEEQMKLQELMVRRAGYEKHLKELSEGTLDLREINSCKKSIDSMKRLVRDQMLAVRNAQRNVEFARMRMNEAIKERKTYEKLKEHAFEDFKEELKQEENKLNDELTSYTYRVN